MLDQIRIVLINTFNSGNIGSAARAMKTMGLTQLYLVQPQDFPSDEASRMACNAGDLLAQATVVDSLAEAVSDCALVIGTSARQRGLPWPMLDSEQCAEKSVMEARQGAKVAVVFGRETMGLHNDELQQCNYHVSIPANPDYPVLNVASAVQIICYEIWKRSQQTELSSKTEESEQQTYPSSREMELFYQHLEETLTDTHFIIKQHPGKIMTRLRRLFNRARPEQMELAILRGILSSVQRELGSVRKED